MPLWSQNKEDGRIHRWPWEDEIISTAEYTRSSESLLRFLNTVQVSTLHTLEDLSAVASLVGHDLHALIVARGRKQEKKVEQVEADASETLVTIEREYVLSGHIRDCIIVVTAGDDHVIVSEQSKFGFQGYQREVLRVRLLSDGDIAIGNTATIEERSIYALDLRGSMVREYHPAIEPYNAAIQQGFTAVLKDALTDVITVLSPFAQVRGETVVLS